MDVLVSVLQPFPLSVTRDKDIQSNPVNTNTEGAIESIRIYGMPVLSGLNLEKM